MWVLPSMSRPAQCAEVLERIRDVGCSTKGIVFINGLEMSDEYNNALSGKLPPGWKIEFWPENIGCIGALNKVFELFPHEPFYGFLGDDEFILPESPKDWDLKLVQAAGSWDTAHGWDDLHQGKRFQGYVCIGGDLARAVGHLAIPGCFHNFGFDNSWEWLTIPESFGGGQACLSHLLPEIKVEHKHGFRDRTRLDDCYRLGYSTFEKDRAVFTRWQKEELKIIAERVKRLKREAA